MSTFTIESRGWPVTIHESWDTVPRGTLGWFGYNTKQYWDGAKNPGILTGYIRRYARDNGGTAVWHIWPDDNGRWHLHVGDGTEAK